MSSQSEKLELFRTLHAGGAPLDLVLAQAARIAASVDLPVSVDFEAGNSASFGGIRENMQRLIAVGAVGLEP
ncbi:isocitrate lyase/phosphoenolpyruvate mutase family protein [Hyphomonas sp.]|jgi:2-methylisocitrate lyase-like PEP mutase family enzyme|uniref:isocitrate lyase/phosphoenolpyruvate mutase family protein n=1 Tax=Hyphomonas sp. TaxID=87 RepID=UPI00333FF2D7